MSILGSGVTGIHTGCVNKHSDKLLLMKLKWSSVLMIET